MTGTELWNSPNGKWKILKVIHPRTRKIRVEITDGWIAEIPIRYDNGNVAYDHPEWFPKYVREKAERFIRLLVESGEYDRYVPEEG